VRKIDMQRLRRDEKGQTLFLALILLAVGGLIVTSLLGYMSTGLLTGQMYENKMYEQYAADAGVEDALCQIKNVGLADLCVGYDEYDYSTPYQYPYDLDINDKNVHVTIQNVWIPKGITAPSTATARQIIEQCKLIIAGNPSLTGAQYEIRIGYDPTCAGPGNALVKTIGIWLPPGFAYVKGSSDLEKATGKPYYSVANVNTHKGGYAVVWTPVSSIAVKDFPKSFSFQYSGPAEKTPWAAVSWIEIDATPYYTWDADVKVYKISSTATDPNTGKQTTVESYSSRTEPRKVGSAISGDYHVIGATLMTTTDSPNNRSRLFRESSATLAPGIIPSNAVIEAAYLYWSGWIEEGSESVIIFQDNCSDFNAPSMAWTKGNAWDISNGRFRGTAYNKPAPVGRYLTMSSSIDLSAYVGRIVEVAWEQAEDGTLGQDDRLYYAFSGDGGNTWSADYEAFRDDDPPSSFSNTIPGQYLTSSFKMRFYLHGFNEGGWPSQTAYCYIDNIEISMLQSLVESAKVNRVMFGTTGNMTQITSNQWQIESTPDAGEQLASTGGENSWSYSCYYDATDIVRAHLDPGTKSGTFTLGHVLEGNGYTLYPSGTTGYPLATPAVKTLWYYPYYPSQYEWTYAGWSLIIIYSTPETEGHQLYLFDTFRYIGKGGNPTQVAFNISGFLAPDDTTGSHLTYFVGEGDDFYKGDSIKINGHLLSDAVNPSDNVFNSHSNAINDPTFKSGIDIDTFDISTYINPADISANVVLITSKPGGQDYAEIYNLVYIILSFRSEITSGGVIAYLIKG
jgi:hypothetical protein